MSIINNFIYYLFQKYINKKFIKNNIKKYKFYFLIIFYL